MPAPGTLFTLRDAEHLSDGTPLREVMAALADNPQVVAVGINCIALENTPAALAHLHSLTALPLVVYPNSGEHYDAVSKTWHHHGEACATLADYLPQWLAAGAKLIGGCCRTTPKDIAALNAKRWSFCRVALRLPGLHIARSVAATRRQPSATHQPLKTNYPFPLLF